MSVEIITICSCFQVKKSLYRRVVPLTARIFCNIIPQDKAKIYDMMIGTGVALRLDFRHWPKQMPFHRNVEILTVDSNVHADIEDMSTSAFLSF